ncbi:MAG: 3-hydroxyacyl-ACP dehydratase FabZ [Pseudomonadota bacterium]
MKSNELASLDIEGILKLLPHRYPFILVDRILEVAAGKSIVGLKNVTINEPFFQGHFPARPIMPGVLVLEGMAQVGGLLAFLSHPDMVGEKLIYFAGIDGVRFRQTVVPGDQIIFKLSLLKQKGKIWKMDGKAFVDNKLVAEATLMAAFS